MRTWTIGNRIALGFTALIFIMLALGALAVFNMRRTAGEARQLSDLKVPQVRIANAVERSAHLMLYQMRTYSDTEETNYLRQGRQYLDDARQHVAEARTLGGQSPLLADLKAAADRAESKLEGYQKEVGLTEARTRDIQQNRNDLVAASQAFMDNCEAYLVDMNEKVAGGIQTHSPPETLLDQLQQIGLMKDAMESGNTLRLAIWRSQAERDFDRLRDAQIQFALIKVNLRELQQDTNAIHQMQIKNCQTAAAGFQQNMNELLTNWVAREEVTSNWLAAGTGLLAEAQNTAVKGLADTADSAGRASNSLSSATVRIGGGLLLATVMAAGLAFFTTRSANRVLSQLAVALDDGSNQVANAAGQVSAASQSLAEGSSQQAAAIEETSSSLEEMASMTRRNTENSQKANDLSKRSRQAADKGVQDMQQMNAAIAAIKDSSADIAKIIKTIDEIAFQTNILALNAAVEAARAGEAGMGFAVVAEEVRQLARRSAEAAKETELKILGAISKSALGAELSGKVAQTLNEIAATARQMDELASAVASASREQTQRITHINAAVGQMDKVTQSNAANAEQSASAAEELNAQAEITKQSVAELLQLVGAVRAGPAPALDAMAGKRTMTDPAAIAPGKAHAGRPGARKKNALGKTSENGFKF